MCFLQLRWRKLLKVAAFMIFPTSMMVCLKSIKGSKVTFWRSLFSTFLRVSFNNLIVCNLVINYLNLIKDSIQEQLLTKQFLFEIGVLKKAPVLESVLNKIGGLQLSCGFCEIFKNIFFYKTPPVAASEKLINFPGKHQWQNRYRFTFWLNTTE